ncbi:MAG: peptidase S10, partial [Myxococcota bacterium]
MSESKEPAEKGGERTARVTEHTLGGSLRYQATADWMVLRQDEEPIAEMFHVAYTKIDAAPATRPITFVFNGGPG